MSSHREAPEISKDPVADNTDTYAFVSPDRPDTVTLISNYVPLEEPPGGPNFFEFGNDVLYEILIDNDGDGLADDAGHVVVDLAADEDDAILEQPREDVPAALSAMRLLHNGGDVHRSIIADVRLWGRCCDEVAGIVRLGRRPTGGGRQAGLDQQQRTGASERR